MQGRNREGGTVVREVWLKTTTIQYDARACAVCAIITPVSQSSSIFPFLTSHHCYVIGYFTIDVDSGIYYQSEGLGCLILLLWKGVLQYFYFTSILYSIRR